MRTSKNQKLLLGPRLVVKQQINGNNLSNTMTFKHHNTVQRNVITYTQ